jgi:hypothetical protein
VRLGHVLVAALAATAAASVVAVGVPAARAALPACPTQSQLEQHGATASEVSSPPQLSTGTFPVAANLNVPDEQCSYQGTLSLLLLYWGLSPAQLAVAKEHFQYLCKQKKCTVYLNKGSNTELSTSPGGKTKTTSRPTLVEVVIAGSLNGEATVVNPPTSHAPCDKLAHLLFGFFAGVSPVGKESTTLLEDFDCP